MQLATPMIITKMSTLSTWRRRFMGVLIALLLSIGLAAIGPIEPAAAGVRTTCASNSPTKWRWKTAQSRAVSQAWCIQRTLNGTHLWLVWQSDGNFVLYKKVNGNRHAIWATGTNGRGKVLRWGATGNFAIYDGSGHRIWSAANVWESGTVGRTPFTSDSYPIRPRRTGEAYGVDLAFWSDGGLGFGTTLWATPNTGRGLFSLGRW